ncbi:MAG TPA: response regulator [Bryobacteraceae bacterium]|nr:response regulator [Bryobacteraceae bacterium]
MENLAMQATILVVDDEPMVLGFLTGTLSRYGYRVVQAESGAQALRLCKDRGHTIDLILTDVVMPGLNGKDLVEAIRSLGLDPKTLFMSGFTRDIAAETGFTDWASFIQKPFTPTQLIGKVREILGHRTATAGAKSGGGESAF